MSGIKQAHSAGYTDICYDDNGDLIGCSGADGEVKIFSGFEDEDPIVHKIGEVIYALAIKNERIYVANEMNAIQAYTLIDGMNDGVMLRFTAPSHHFLFNKSGSILVAGSSDTTLRCLNLETKAQKLFEGHDAPVLSVALHSNDNIIASSSCDGSVRVWDLVTQKCLRIINCLPKSNSFENSKTLGRLLFRNQELVIPCREAVKFYSIESWDVSLEITKPYIDQIVTMINFSFDDKHFLCSTDDGNLYLFDSTTNMIVKSEKIDSKSVATSLSWHPDSTRYVYADSRGRIHITAFESRIGDSLQQHQVSNLFAENDDDDDDLILSGINDQSDDVLYNHISLSSNPSNKISSKETRIIDEESLSIKSTLSKSQQILPSKLAKIVVDNRNESKQGKIKLHDGDDVDESKSKTYLKSMDDNAYESNDGMSLGDAMEEGSEMGGIPGIDTDGEEEDELKPGGKKAPPGVFNDDASNDKLSYTNVLAPQLTAKPGWEPTPMQPSFQPSATPPAYSRFMLWNDVGRIVQYDTEEEQTINIEFHDSSVHHAIHISNSSSNYSLAALNSEALVLASQADAQVPSQVFCMHFASWDITKEWVSILPSNEDVRCVAIGDGWLAAATSSANVRLFAYGGTQLEIFTVAGPILCLAAQLDMLLVVYHNALAISGDQCLSFDLISVSKKKNLYSNRLPISPKSTLKWIGFSSEGTPFSVDSSGVVRIYNRAFGNSWTPVANLNDHLKSLSDSFWVVSVREEPQQLRAIFCKSSKYPSVLPPPTMQILPFKIPMCDPISEKSIIEENYWRSTIFSEHFNYWKIEDFDFDEEEQKKAENIQQEFLIKLFALACRSKKDFRAVEIGEMLGSSRVVELATKYAIQKGAMHLAHRLEEVSRGKSENENLKAAEERRKFLMKDADMQNKIQEKEADHVGAIDDGDDDSLSVEHSRDNSKSNPLLHWKSRDENSKPIASNISLSTSQTSKLIKNPFRVLAAESKSPSIVGSIIFDTVEVAKRTPKMLATADTLMPKKITIGQQKLFSSNTSNSIKDNDQNIIRKTGFEIWLEENKSSLAIENADVADDELTIIAVKKYKSLAKELQKEYNEKAKSLACKSVDKKEKSTDCDSALIPLL